MTQISLTLHFKGKIYLLAAKRYEKNSSEGHLLSATEKYRI